MESDPETAQPGNRPQGESGAARGGLATGGSPEWRVVPEELWNAAHARIRLVNEHVGRMRYGDSIGPHTAGNTCSVGCLCGLCGSRMVIISGRGRRGYVRYGCPSHRYRGVCDNRVTIRQDRLEEQLLAEIEGCILTPEMIEYTLERFAEELQGRLIETRRQAGRSTQLAGLHRRREELAAQAGIADAIAVAGHSPSLLSRLATAEAELARITQEIETHKPINVTATIADIQELVTKNVRQLRNLLRGNAPTAKAALMKHVKQLVLTPEDRPTGPVFKVSGGIQVLSSTDAMPMVARTESVFHQVSLLSKSFVYCESAMRKRSNRGLTAQKRYKRQPSAAGRRVPWLS